MVQKLFSIYTEPEESHHLHVEVGTQHIACWCDDKQTGFTALEYFTFSYDNTEGGFIDIFREIKRGSILLRNKFASQEIVWENANFIFVPRQYFHESKAPDYLRLVGSQSFQSLPMFTMVNDLAVTYTADSILYKTVKENLPGATHTHKFGQLLQQRKAETDNSLQLQFYQSYFLLTACKDGQFQLAAVYRFETPQEAVYHVLNTLDKLEMKAAETQTWVTGFIDEKSSLYKELYSYVNNLQLAQVGKIKDEHPAHYFTTYNLS